MFIYSFCSLIQILAPQLKLRLEGLNLSTVLPACDDFPICKDTTASLRNLGGKLEKQVANIFILMLRNIR